jgi:hypothetical protein
MTEEGGYSFTKLQRETDGTLSPAQINALPITGLIHTVTDFNNGKQLIPQLETILKDGFLRDTTQRITKEQLKKQLHRYIGAWKEAQDPEWLKYCWTNDVVEGVGTIRFDQFPGVYFRACDLSTTWFPEDGWVATGLTFILSTALLRKRAWHLALTFQMNGGIDTKNIYDYTTADQLLIGEQEHFFAGEVVLHYPVSLDYCEGILCPETIRKELVQEVLQSYGRIIPVLYMNELDVAPKKFSKSMFSHFGRNEYPDTEPNYCYFAQMKAAGECFCDPGSMPNILFNTLLNSGIERSEAWKMLQTKSVMELIVTIQERRLAAIEGNYTYPPVVHPPDIHTRKPSQY